MTGKRIGWLAVGAAVVALVGCSSSSKSSSSSAQGLTASAAVSASASTSAGGSGGSGVTGKLESLTGKVKAAETSSFKAVYNVTGGAATQITIAQDPPKTYFAAGSTTLINTGSGTYACTSGQCISFSSGGANPLVGLTQLVSPDGFISAAQAAETEAEANAAGANIDFSNASFGGLASTCVTFGANGQSAKYCVTDSGILAYAGTPASSISLVSYSTSVDASLFALPAGASTMTLPAGIPGVPGGIPSAP